LGKTEGVSPSGGKKNQKSGGGRKSIGVLLNNLKRWQGTELPEVGGLRKKVYPRVTVEARERLGGPKGKGGWPENTIGERNCSLTSAKKKTKGGAGEHMRGEREEKIDHAASKTQRRK